MQIISTLFSRFHSLFFFSFLFFSAVIGLKDLNVRVPEAVAVGDTVTLSCEYDLETAALYAVRWYFDTEEFFRFMPKELPPAIGFPTNELEIDVSISSLDKLVLI